jgi:predicted alpha/beta-fold hydrolase
MDLKLITQIRKIQSGIPPMTPPFWAVDGHLQTILGTLLKSPPAPLVDQTFILPLETPHERLHLSYIKGTRPIVTHLFHGLAGSINSPYVRRFAQMSKSLGHHVFMVNMRGCGAGAGLAKLPYHSGRSEDISSVISFGRKLIPEATHVAVGVSLSANALLLNAAGVRAESRPDLAIAINAPINLEDSAIKLKAGLNRIYDQHFTRALKNYLLKNIPENMGDYSLVEDLHDFDNRYTAPFGGFKSREDYYQTCSSDQFLSKIDIPTVIITSEDDPFVDASFYKRSKISPTTTLNLQPHGGHIGYLSSQGLGFKFWLDEAVKSYLLALH